jgi:hypothetical protein
MTHSSQVSKNCNRVFDILTNSLYPNDNSGRFKVVSGTFIAGGSLVQSEDPPNDFDVFFTNPEVARDLLLKISQKIASSNSTRLRNCLGQASVLQLEGGVSSLVLGDPGKLENVKLSPVTNIHSGNSHSLSHLRPANISSNAVTTTSRIQLVTRFIGPIENVFGTFDFEHCKVAWKPAALHPLGGTIQYYGESERAISEKILLYRGGSRFVLSAFKRIEKFVKRGWTLPLTTILQLQQSLAQLDLTSPEKLFEELSTYYGVTDEIAVRVVE